MTAHRSVKDIQSLLRQMRVDYRDCLERQDLVRRLSSAYAGYFGKTYIVEPRREHKASMVFCHGLGDSGEGWLDFVRYRLAVKFPSTRFVLPTAAEMPVTISGGVGMNAWYDITSISLEGRDADGPSLQLSASYVEHLIEAEKERIRQSGGSGSSDRVVLGGFSQGAALAMFTMLTSPQALAGVVGLSGYFPGRESALPQSLQRVHRAIPLEKSSEVSCTPIFIAHGNQDFVVPVGLASRTVDFLRTDVGMDASCVRVKYYDNLGHSTNAEEERDIIDFLAERLE
ncbi:Phospholipase/carboxylesterase [Perkinsela sp. CCAP 1560/4]|nr:Phospholipase/carboxylesterase [Perkinsela sp. CCAP 1560/4]|eukprot:KNH07746.1 Phospholipase/carboxylesterase [Perkinsela sp. CCAP 1560/4]